VSNFNSHNLFTNAKDWEIGGAVARADSPTARWETKLLHAITDRSPDEAKWRTSGGGIELLGSQCAACGVVAFPPKSLCSACGKADTVTVALPRRGRLYSFSTIHIAPPGLPTPYTVGFVDFDNDVRVFAQIEGQPGSFEIDQPVEPVIGTIRIGEDGPVVGYKFRKVH
jgi:benzoylsuccinyl-CoA thiolase BbsA subunit